MQGGSSRGSCRVQHATARVLLAVVGAGILLLAMLASPHTPHRFSANAAPSPFDTKPDLEDWEIEQTIDDVNVLQPDAIDFDPLLPFYAEPGEHACTICQFILESTDGASYHSLSKLVTDIQSGVCASIAHTTTANQCSNIAAFYKHDIINGHCDSACRAVSPADSNNEDADASVLLTRERRSACSSHFDCTSSTFCGTDFRCNPCTECSARGFSVALGGFCPCLGGTIEGLAPSAGETVTGGSLFPIVFTSTNAGPAVDIELYDASDRLRNRVRRAVRVTGNETTYTWPVPRALPTGSYYLTITSITSASISGRVPASGYFSYVRNYMCQSHDVCAATSYCDTRNYCYPCRFCSTFDDAFDGECPLKCSERVSTNPKVTFASPTQSTTIPTNSHLPVIWSYNDYVLDYLSLYLLPISSFSSVIQLGARVSTQSGSLSYRIPRWFPEGQYWIAATHSDDRVLRIIGVAPETSSFSSVGFTIVNTGCQAHDACADDEYCDYDGVCSECSLCLRSDDAFNGECPAKCGDASILPYGQVFPPNSDEDVVSGGLTTLIHPGCPQFDELEDVPTSTTLRFASNVGGNHPNRMSLRLRRHLESLASRIQAVFGDEAYLYVQAAYNAPPADVSLVSLHNAGRAAEITVRGFTEGMFEDQLLEVLGGLAVHVGFDFVSHMSTTHIYVSVIPDTCRSHLDLVFLLDASGSIESEYYGGREGTFGDRVLPFVKRVASYFDIGEDKTRVAVATFASDANIEFHLNEHYDADELAEAIADVQYTRGGTSTSLGLRAVRTSIFTEANGMRPESEGIPRVLVVITDGNAQPAYAPAAEAALLQDNNVNVFSIGVGDDIDLSELQAIASNPDDKHVFRLKSFLQIGDIVDAMSATACEAPTILTAGRTVSLTISPCETLYFRPSCASTSPIEIELTSDDGLADMFVSYRTSTPSPFNHFVSVTGDDLVKTLHLDPVANATFYNPRAYIAVQSRASEPISIKLTLWSDLFDGVMSPSATVSEDAPVGTRVLVTPSSAAAARLANVADLALEFSIVSGGDGLFSINPRTGVVSTAALLDREVASSYTLRISAHSSVLPCLTGILDAQIEIGDVNDNKPVFSEQSYRSVVAEGKPRGTQVLQVSASDLDSAAYSTITYSIISMAPFAIDGSSGVITTTAVLNYEDASSYTFTVVASDGFFTTMATVTIDVTPVPCPQGTSSPTGTLPCTACAAGTFAETPGATSCRTCGCQAGFYAAGECTSIRNFDCLACPTNSNSTAGSTQLSHCMCHNGFYKVDSPNADTFTCHQCSSSCPSGQYMARECSRTANTVCAPCTTTCRSGFFLSGTCSTESNTECVECSACEAGEYVSAPCTVAQNRECGECTTFDDCEEGEYLDSTCDNGPLTQNPQCRTCVTSCPSGEFLTGECGGMSGLNRTRCAACSTCRSNQYTAEPCTDSSDTVCMDCLTGCDSGMYLVGECGPNNDPPTCEPCVTADDCEGDQYLTAAMCGGTTSPSCEDCDESCASCDGPGPSSCTSCADGESLLRGECLGSCPRGFYDDNGSCKACDENCAGCTGNATFCTVCDVTLDLVLNQADHTCVSECPEGEYADFESGVCAQCRVCSNSFATGGCTGAQNTICTPWSPPCEPGSTYQSQNPSPYQDRQCSECKTSCPAGQQLAGQCVTSDFSCETCPDGTYKDGSGGERCAPCPTSCGSTEYLTGVCNATHTTRCLTCRSECAADEFLSGVCNGGRTNPVCKNCAVCEENQFQTAACTSSNGGTNTKCADCLDECPEGSYMSRPCSQFSNAQCTTCPTEEDCLSTEVLVGECSNNSTTSCRPCHIQCLQCDGVGPSDCTTCGSGLFLTGDGTCVNDCGAGMYEVRSPGSNGGTCHACHDDCADCVGPESDMCTGCDDGTFLLGTVCVPECPSGFYADVASATCERCSTCPSGFFADGGCSGTDDTACSAWTECSNTQYQVISPTSVRDRTCAPCRESCEAGFELVGVCGGVEGTSNPTCERCDLGFFKADVGGAACAACRTSCEEGFFLTGECTDTTEPTCEACRSTCPSGSHLTGECAGSTDFSCTPCTTCDEGMYETGPCTSNSNRVCETCRTSCPTGQFLVGECEGTMQPSCASCTTADECAANQYLSGQCAGRTDATCEDCHPSCSRCSGPAASDCLSCPANRHLEVDSTCVSECDFGRFENNGTCSSCDDTCADCNGGAFTDCVACEGDRFLSSEGRCVTQCPEGTYANTTSNLCVNCASCPRGFYESEACETDADTVCTAWTTCDAGTFQSAAPTSVSDRECESCTTSCQAGFELSVPCTSTQDAHCTECSSGMFKASNTGPGPCIHCISQCIEGYFLTGECTTTTSPSCSRCTHECQEGYFLDGECAGRENTACVECDTCPDGHFISRECTLNTNRQCTECTNADDCEDGEYLDGACTLLSDPTCEVCTTVDDCAANEYLSGSCSKDGPNPTCETCTPCAPDEYETSPCTATSNRQCSKCIDSCPAGEFLVGSCPGNLADRFPKTAVLDGVTYALLSGVSPDTSSLECATTPTKIPTGWTLTTDAEAATLVASLHNWGSPCVILSASAAVPTALFSTQTAVTSCACLPEEGCISNSNGFLLPTVCPRGILIERRTTSCRECTSSCPANHYLDGECAGRTNPTCRQCTECAEGEEYQTVPCTHLDVGTQNRECASCTTADDCADGEYLSGACEGSNNPTCETCLTNCPMNQYLSGTCGGTQATTCEDCTQCVEGEEYVVAECTSTSNTECEACTTADQCDANQFLDGECTLEGSPVCSPCTTSSDCENNEYLAGICGGTTDAACMPCHPSCASCSGPHSSQCLSCDATLSLSRGNGTREGTCVSECPPGQAENPASNTCEMCDATCTTCSTIEADGCTSCSGPLFLTSAGTCTNACPENHFGDASENVCVQCDSCPQGTYASVSCTHATPRECEDLSTCPAGTFVAVPATPSSNRECEDCPDNTFSSAANQGVCSNVVMCNPATQYETSAPTSSSNRVCAPLTTCTSAQFESAAPTATSNRNCTAYSQCGGNEWESTAPTTTSDRACTALTVCNATEYQSAAPTDTSDRECSPITVCDDDEYQSVPATALSNAQCEQLRVCTEGEEFESAAPTYTSNRECRAYNPCNFASEYILVDATPTSDFVCARLTICSRPIQFESVAPTQTSDRECATCTLCNPLQFQVSTCTETEDRVCANLTVCGMDEFETLTATLTSNRECDDCTVCSDNSYTVRACGTTRDTLCDMCTPCSASQYISTACGGDQDNVCADCATCADDEFISRTCGGSSNTQCSPCTVCDANSYYTRLCSEFSDSACAPIRNCTSSQFESAAPTSTSNRECSPITSCDFTTQYQTAAATATSNTMCADLRVCVEGEEYESTPKTQTSNRECSDLDVCIAGSQYEQTAPTTTSNRVCRDYTECIAGQEVSVQPTSSSDRECRFCPAGTSDVNSFGGDACVQCDPGTFVPGGSVGECSLFQCPPGTADTDTNPATPCVACNGMTNFVNFAGAIACQSTTTCSAGSEEAQAPTAVSNRVCRSCQLGTTFKENPGQSTRCTNTTTCPAGQELTIAATLSSDRICTTCAANTFKSLAGQSTSCVAVRTCPPGMQEAAAPTPSTNRVCESCPNGSFKTSTGQQQCVEHTQCSEDQYQVTAPTVTSDRTCANITLCVEGLEYEDAAPTITSNRVCRACDECPSGRTETVACTLSTNRMCSDCSECLNTQFISSVCTASDDTGCTACSSCDADLQFQVRACSSHNDTVCADLTTCSAVQYELTAPTETSNRVCEDITVCSSDPPQFVSVAATLTSDAECDDVTPCVEGQEEEAAPTPSSNRVCRTCPAGTTDNDANWESPCQACAPGSFVPEGSTGDCSAYLCEPGTADLDRDPSTPCEPCPEGTFQVGLNATTCNDHSTCAAGQTELMPPTAMFDRVCIPCGFGTFKTEPGNFACSDASECDLATQFIIMEATMTADTQCGTISQCGDNQFQSSEATMFSDTVCRNVTVCTDTEYLSRAATNVSDAICHSYTPECTSDFFEAVAPTPTSDRRCDPYIVCEAGQFESLAPTPTSNRECTFWRECTEGFEYQSLSPTAFRNRECSPITECAEGSQYEVESPTETSNRECEACTVCPDETHFETAPCTPLQNRECQGCTACQSGFYASSPCTDMSNTVCTLCDSCIEGATFQTVPCSPTENTQCGLCASCGEGQFIAATCTELSNTECQDYTLCEMDQFELTEPTRFSDRVCQQHTLCILGETYEVEAPTAFSDRECDSVTVCSESEFIKAQPTLTSDTECQSYTVCTTSQFQFTAPTDSSDRVCRDATVCQDDEYEAEPLGFATDRVCLPHNICADDEYYSSPPTPVSPGTCAMQVLPELAPLTFFSTSGGLALSGQTEYSADEAEQASLLLNIAASRSPSAVSSATLNAHVGSSVAQASVCIAHPAPVSVRFFPAGEGVVYADNPFIRGTFQVVTESLLASPVDVRLRATLVGANSVVVQGTCTTDADTGLCNVVAEVPAALFTEGAQMRLAVGLAAEDFATYVEAATVSLEPITPFTPMRDIYTELPIRDLRPGEQFSIDVVANTGDSVSSFTSLVSVQAGSGLTIDNVLIDAGTWQGAAVVQNSGLQAGVTAVLLDAFNSDTAGSVVVFSVFFTVADNASPGLESIDVVFSDLANTKGEAVLPGGRAFPARAVFVDRNGADAADAGVVSIGSTATEAIIAVPTTRTLVNMAILSGQQVSYSVSFHALQDSGTLTQVAPDTGAVTCSSSDTSVVKVSSSCQLVFSGDEDVAANAPHTATITVVLASNPSITDSFDVTVWTPVAGSVSLSSEDTTLNAISGWLDASDNCAQRFQQARVSAFANFTDGSGALVANVDVTAHVSLEVSDNGVASIAHVSDPTHGFVRTVVSGLREGSFSVITSAGMAGPSLDFTVDASSAVIATRLDVTPVATLSVAFDGVTGCASQYDLLGAVVSVGSQFTSEGQSAPVAASVVLSDSTRMPLTTADGLSLLSLNTGSIAVQGSSIVALGASIDEYAVEATWAVSACSSTIISTTVELDVAIPLATAIATSATEVTLAAPGSTAASALLQHPTSASVSVVATLVAGGQVDVTSSPHLAVSSSAGISTAIANGKLQIHVGTGSSTGAYTVSLLFEDTTTATINVNVVDAEELEARCALLVDGEATSSATNTLAPYAGTNVHQECALQVRVSYTPTTFSDWFSVTDAMASVSTSAAIMINPTTGVVSAIEGEGAVMASIDVELTTAASLATTIVIEVVTTPITITGGSISVAATALSGHPFSTVSPSVSLTFSDGSSISERTAVPVGLVEYSLTNAGTPASVEVDSSTGLLTLLEVNSIDAVTLTMSASASAGGAEIASASFFVNLAADVGELDFGNINGPAFHDVFTSTLVTFNINANSGNSPVANLAFDIAFDPAKAEFVSVSAGSDYSGGVSGFTSVLSATDRVSVTFTPTGTVAGQDLHVATAIFRITAAVGEIVSFEGIVTDFRSDATTRIGTRDLPYVSAASSISAVVAPNPNNNSRRRRSDVDVAVDDFAASLLLSRSRRAVATQPCATPPCAICGMGDTHQTGDTNADCVFDLDDVLFLQQTLVSTLFDPSHIATLLPIQQVQMDADGNGVIDSADGDLLLRVLNKYTRFVRDVTVTPVSADDGCLLRISASVLDVGDIAPVVSTTHVYFNIESAASGFSTMFANSDVLVGAAEPMITTGPTLQGGLWRAAHEDGTTWAVEVHTDIATADNVGVSVFLFTSLASAGIDTSNVNSDALMTHWGGVRSAPFEYGEVDFELTLSNTPTFVVSLSGFNSLDSFVNDETSEACHLSTSCDSASEYTVADPTPSSSAVCADYTVCASHQYQDTAPTASSDRHCTNTTICEDFQFRMTQATATTDRVCTNYTMCAEDETEVVAPTEVSDRLCRTNLPCPTTHYESVPLTATTDRSCVMYTECTDGAFEVVAPTPTSDRECELPDFCEGVTCQNGGVCISGTSDYTCNCPTGFEGRNCEFLDACEVYASIGSDPCNGFPCESFEGGVQCQCTALEAACACCDQDFFLVGSCNFLGLLENDGSYCQTPDEVAVVAQQASQNNNNSGSSGISASTASVIAGVCGGVIFVLLLLMFIGRSRRKSKTSSLTEGEALLSMNELVNPAYDPLYMFKAGFRRVIAFNFARYNGKLVNAPADLPADTVGTLYDILLVPRPPEKHLKLLMSDTNDLMQSPVSKDDNENAALTFIENAVADALFEELLDSYVMQDTQGTYHPNVADDADGLVEQEWATFLDPTTGVPELDQATFKRQKTLTVAGVSRLLGRRNRHTSERSRLLDLATDTEGEEDDYDIATKERDASDGYIEAREHPSADYSVGDGRDEATYDNSMGNGNTEYEATYDNGNNGDDDDDDNDDDDYSSANFVGRGQDLKRSYRFRRSLVGETEVDADYDIASTIEQDATYDVGTGDEPDYDIGNRPATGNSGYDHRGHQGFEEDYELANKPTGDYEDAARVATGDDYDLATQTGDNEPDYVLGDGDGDNDYVLASDNTHARGNEAEYDMASNNATGNADEPDYDIGGVIDNPDYVYHAGPLRPSDDGPDYSVANANANDDDDDEDNNDEGDYDNAQPVYQSPPPRTVAGSDLSGNQLGNPNAIAVDLDLSVEEDNFPPASS